MASAGVVMTTTQPMASSNNNNKKPVEKQATILVARQPTQTAVEVKQPTKKTHVQKKSLPIQTSLLPLPDKDNDTTATKAPTNSSKPKHRRRASSPMNSKSSVHDYSQSINTSKSFEPPVTPVRQLQKKIGSRKAVTPAAVPSTRGAHLKPTPATFHDVSKTTKQSLPPKLPALDVSGTTSTPTTPTPPRATRNKGKIPPKQRPDGLSASDHGVLPKGVSKSTTTTTGRKSKVSPKAGGSSTERLAKNPPFGKQKVTTKSTPKVATPANVISKSKSGIVHQESANSSPPPQQRSESSVAVNRSSALSSTIHGSIPSPHQTSRTTARRMKGRKSTLDANTTHLNGFRASRPLLHAHLNVPMGSNSDVATRQRTRLSADDESVAREIKEPPSSRHNNHQHHKGQSHSKGVASSNNTLTYFGNPLVPIDIVDKTDRPPKLNLMHHKDALQVLNEIQHMQRGQLKVKFKSEAAIQSTRPTVVESSLTKPPLQRQQTKELQVIQILKTAGTSTSATISMTGFKGGPLENQINQDRSLIVSPFYLRNHSNSTIRRRLIGVFDGHAESGAKFAEHCQQRLPSMLSRKLSEAFKKAAEDIATGVVKNGEDEVSITKRVLIESFVAMDESSPEEESGGCTATVIYQQGKRVFIANAGDSRSFCVVYRKNQNQQHQDENITSKADKSATVKVAYMSREDKPDLPEERKRLEAAGGEIILPEKSKSSKVRFNSSQPGMASATLSMSRSIGDWQFTPLGVIPDPTVDVVDLEELVEKERKLAGEKDTEDDVCIFALCVSDGMMIESNEDAEALATEMAPSLFQDDAPHPLTACQGAIRKAAAVWEKRNKGKFRDDITIAITVLRTPTDTGTGRSSKK